MKLFELLEKNLTDEEAKLPVPKQIAVPEKETHVTVPPPNERWEEMPVFENTEPDTGLTEQEAARRLLKNGRNQLSAKRKISVASLFFAQYKDIMTIILIVCTAISVFMGDLVEAVTIAIIVLMNGILGFVQEYRTEKTLDALKDMASPTAKVCRDGAIRHIEAEKVVAGDIVLLEAGDRIPADGTLFDSIGMECDESMLSGESLPVKKGTELPQNKVYMGCVVTKGHGRYTVVKTGMKTEMGHIASMLQTIESDTTPLQKRLAQLSKYIAAACLIVCAVVSVTGILRGENPLDMLLTGVSLAVAAVPEGLTAVVTISLALSVSRMVKRNALVRRLPAVETLGCATVICTDKTGTITQNHMAATDICLSTGQYDAAKLDCKNTAIDLLLKCLSLCNNAVAAKGKKPSYGGHTELALLHLASRYGYRREEMPYRRLSEQPFDSTRKRMSVTVCDSLGQKTLFCKGAFDILLEHCSFYQDGSEIKPLYPNMKKLFFAQSDALAEQALRVIGVCYKPVDNVSPNEAENNLIFLGLVGMIDPPRKEVKEAVFRCHKAGIKTVMITGDHKKTAEAIARKVGIYHEGDLILTGRELDSMDDIHLCDVINRVTVFARVNPSDKLRIVRAFKRKGHVVAMTGDGVNDAPAVKEADIGVSMGENGTDVTKEASEIILLDDNFVTLVNAVDEGRSIYQNIRKFIRYLLSCNIGEVLTMFLGMLFGMPVILFPIQILLVNLVTDGLPAIALGMEPSDKRAMGRPPRRPDESVFSRGLATKIVIRGILIGITTLASFTTVFSMTHSVASARSAALFALIFAQLIHVFECKSEEKSLFQIPILDNKLLLGAAGLSLLTLLLVLYVPCLAVIFKTVPLALKELAVPVFYCMIVPIIAGILNSKSSAA